MLVHGRARRERRQPVSILIRPEGRMLVRLGRWRCRSGSCGFNPHPARGPDAGASPHARRWAASSFNPHPARGPDAGSHSQPLGRDFAGFNPHPARGPDAGSRPTNCSATTSCFNPHPARGPDAGRGARCGRSRRLDLVSILIRTEGRMLVTTDKIAPNAVSAFQSSSGPRAGCWAVAGAAMAVKFGRFQSSSGPRAGCWRRGPGCRWRGTRRFNPHPARGPDAGYCARVRSEYS